MIGKTLSHYKVIEKIGQGGMGEVYRAEDTNLSREVAIKVLPEQFTKDPQRLARFEREAKLLAQLNHPNIAAIYGLENAEGIRFLALELVEGETLAERVAKGPLPVEEALEVCRQIAEGIEAAHEKGVIHRDLKPANVKVTPEGKVKILDFGLAKAFEEETPVADISQSPTLTEEMTRAGVILGTAAYMSPEQAKGRPVDKRADIFAFGCLLYELLVGKRVFEGETIPETLGATIHKEPKWDVLPSTLPGTIRFLLNRCLQKDPDRRFQHIDGARILIEEALSGATTATGLPMAEPPSRGGWVRTVGAVILTAVVVGLAVWSLMRSSTLTSPSVTRLVLTHRESSSSFMNTLGNDLAISPDGKSIVYRAMQKGTAYLFHRPLTTFEVTRIPGTEGVSPHPFFAPDSKSVAFVADSKLKRVSLEGGSPITVCETPTSGDLFHGGSWDLEGRMVFSTDNGLSLVSATGGVPESLIVADAEKGEISYWYPELLPSREVVLFTMMTNDGPVIGVVSLDTGDRQILIVGAREARYSPTGHLVYEEAGTGVLMAVRFDLSRLEADGGSIPVLQGIRQHRWVPSSTDYSLAWNGTLVYIPTLESGARSLVWVDRQGTESVITAEDRNYAGPRLSPDGRQIVFTQIEDDGQRQVWIYEFESDSYRRLTFEGLNGSPSWSPDSEWIAIGSTRDGPQNIYRKRADGTGVTERLTTSPNLQMVNAWSPDGTEVAFVEASPKTGIWILSMGENAEPELLIENGYYPAYSRDNQWLAYSSSEAGRSHVFVSPRGDPTVKFLVSGEEGGAQPVWSPGGSELFYRSVDRMMVVPVQTKPSFQSGKPKVLFEGSYLYSPTNPQYQYYDISSDGQRFLMVREQRKEVQINVVLNWFEELKRLVPTDR